MVRERYGYCDVNIHVSTHRLLSSLIKDVLFVCLRNGKETCVL